jgi:hypothetical protein
MRALRLSPRAPRCKPSTAEKLGGRGAGFDAAKLDGSSPAGVQLEHVQRVTQSASIELPLASLAARRLRFRSRATQNEIVRRHERKEVQRWSRS